MIKHIITDLSEVLILGLWHLDPPVSAALGLPPGPHDNVFWGPHLVELLNGRLAEDPYFDRVREQNSWTLSNAELKSLVRKNFEVHVPGTLEVLSSLKANYTLTLLSDHGREWVTHIRQVHSFIAELFTYVFFSCDLGSTKQDPETFKRVLKTMGAEARECLFIDDNPANVKNAESLGIRGIHFVNAHQLRDDLLRHGVAVPPAYLP